MSMSLTAVELEAMELGTTVHDCVGDELTRVEDGWRFSYFENPVLTSGELATYYGPVTLDWHLQDIHLWDFPSIYLNMTDEEQEAINAIVYKALHRTDNEEGTE